MMAFFFFPSFTYMLYVILPSLVLAGIAQLWLKSTFAKYSKVPIEKDQQVAVTAMDGLVLQVEPVATGAADAPAAS